MNMKLELKKATIKDCKDIYRWRTDPINSEGSFTGGNFSYDDHTIWFEGYLENKDNLMLIAGFNDKSCCVLRFDGTVEEKTVSIYMVPGFHGVRLGIQCLLLGERYLRDELGGVGCSLKAEISYENDASMRLFKQAGYICENNADTTSDWYKVTCDSYKVI